MIRKIILFVNLFFICYNNVFSSQRDTVFYKQYDYNSDKFFVDTIALDEYPMHMICKSSILGHTIGNMTLRYVGLHLDSVSIKKTSYDEIGIDYIKYDSIYSIIEDEHYLHVTFYVISFKSRCDFLFDAGYCTDLDEVQLMYYPYAHDETKYPVFPYSSYPIYKMTYHIGKSTPIGGIKKRRKEEPLRFKVYNLPDSICH